MWKKKVFAIFLALLLVLPISGCIREERPPRRVGEQITIGETPLVINDSDAIKIGDDSITIYGANMTIAANGTIYILPTINVTRINLPNGHSIYVNATNWTIIE